MPAPTYRTKLAKLRRACGLDQRAFAQLIGRTLSTVQSLEAKKHQLTEELAREVAECTGASLNWLLFGAEDSEPLDNAGEPFTQQWFEAFNDFEGEAHIPILPDEETPYFPGDFGAVIEAVLASARRKKKGITAAYAIHLFAQSLAREFGSDEQVEAALKTIAEEAWNAGQAVKSRKPGKAARQLEIAEKIGKASLQLRTKIGKP